MTWEIAVGLFTLVSALIAIMNVVVKVNRTLTSLDITVKELDENVRHQSQINQNIFGHLARHERRLAMLEFIEGEPTPRSMAVNDMESALCDLPLVEHRCFGKEAD